MNYPTYGNATYVTVTGTLSITTANAYIIGVLFQASATGALNVLVGGVRSTATVLGSTMRGFSTTGANTVQSAVYVPFPAYCSGGFTVTQPVLDPKLTLFWNPAGGP